MTPPAPLVLPSPFQSVGLPFSGNFPFGLGIHLYTATTGLRAVVVIGLDLPFRSRIYGLCRPPTRCLASHCNHYNMVALDCQHFFQKIFEKVLAIFSIAQPKVATLGNSELRFFKWFRALPIAFSHCQYCSRLYCLCQHFFQKNFSKKISKKVLTFSAYMV